MLLMYILVDIFKGSKDARKSGELVSHQRVEESRSLANLAFVIDPLVFVACWFSPCWPRWETFSSGARDSSSGCSESEEDAQNPDQRHQDA